MTEPLTVIGARTIVKGTIEGDEDVAVEGRVEGSVRLDGTLIVEIDGVVRADVDVRAAVIRGVLAGDVTAGESVHIAEHGRVVGDIKAPRVSLAEGAAFRGHIDMGELDLGFDVEEKPRAERAKAPRGRVPQPSVAPALPSAPPPARGDETTSIKRTVPPPPKVRALGRTKAVKKGS
jgi:cytoskeletal protein CcmA (bactofilin family)